MMNDKNRFLLHVFGTREDRKADYFSFEEHFVSQMSPMSQMSHLFHRLPIGTVPLHCKLSRT
jgi:hypothetical protein